MEVCWSIVHVEVITSGSVSLRKSRLVHVVAGVWKMLVSGQIVAMLKSVHLSMLKLNNSSRPLNRPWGLNKGVNGGSDSTKLPFSDGVNLGVWRGT